MSAPIRTSQVPLTHGRGYCFARLAQACAPRERLTVSEWSDRYRWLTSKQSGQPGKWRTDRNPLLREIQDCFSATSTVSDLSVQKPAQVGLTEVVVNAIGYSMDYDPCPFMVLLPTLENRDKWKLQKLNPLFTDTDRVRNILGGIRSRDAANRQDAVDYPGGILFLSGGNSPNSYAQVTVRKLVQDDLDRFPGEVGVEGDPVALGRGRLKAMARSIHAKISTPTVKGSSPIERELEQSDMRQYHVPCPACGQHQVLQWNNLKWTQNIARVWYECEYCGYEIEEHHKPKMLATGIWIAQHPERKRRGYHFNALYAPIGLGSSWAQLAEEWVLAQGDPALLKTFINTQLAETWEDKTNDLKPNELAKRAEDIEQRVIPVGCLAITIGVDTQDEWLAIHMIGHGAHHIWVLEYVELQGDTSRTDGVWDDLEAYLHTWPTNAFGKTIRFRAAGIDSRGHRSEQVRQFVQRPSLKIPVFAIQGSTTRMNRPIAVNPTSSDKKKKGKLPRGAYGVWNVGTEHCKDFILSRLASDSKHGAGDRYIRFPSGLLDTYYDGLLSEYFDPEKKRYLQRKGARWKRNEPLDTFVYAWAIAHHREVNLGRTRTGRIDPHYWVRLERILEPDGEVVHVPAEKQPEETIHAQDATTKQQDRKRGGRRVRARFN